MKTLRYIFLTLILCIAIAPAVSAQPRPDDKKPDRQEWFRQMRQFKHKFLVKELSLTKQQQDEFLPLYDAMQQEIEKVQQQVRQAERKINRAKDSAVSDADYLQAARVATEAKAREGAVEEMYFDKFSKVLSPKQMFELHFAERKFTRELMKQHNKMAETRNKINKKINKDIQKNRQGKPKEHK